MARLSHVARALVHARLGYEMRFPDRIFTFRLGIGRPRVGQEIQEPSTASKTVMDQGNSHAPWGASRRACERISPLVTVNLP